jgi:hypothetical protein
MHVGPYKRYVQESSWGDVTKMIHTVDRHTRLLLDSPVGETETEYEAYINSSDSQMPIGTLLPRWLPHFGQQSVNTPHLLSTLQPSIIA